MAGETIGEIYNPVMLVQTEEEARQAFDELVATRMREDGWDMGKARRIERSNVLYYSGYMEQECRERIGRLFAFTNSYA